MGEGGEFWQCHVLIEWGGGAGGLDGALKSQSD